MLIPGYVVRLTIVLDRPFIGGCAEARLHVSSGYDQRSTDEYENYLSHVLSFPWLPRIGWVITP